MQQVFGFDDESRASTARLGPGRGRGHSTEDSEEFDVENDDIFMQINNLNLAKDDSSAPAVAMAASEAVKDGEDAVITNLGLPSARTLRGGASIVARGRHEVPNSALSNYSNYSSSSSR